LPLLNLAKITIGYNIELSNHSFNLPDFSGSKKILLFLIKKVLKAFLHYVTGAQILFHTHLFNETLKGSNIK